MTKLPTDERIEILTYWTEELPPEIGNDVMRALRELLARRAAMREMADALGPMAAFAKIDGESDDLIIAHSSNGPEGYIRAELLYRHCVAADLALARAREIDG